jgi:prepilin-type N-terminal cleavage/methylation domain-containing protein
MKMNQRGMTLVEVLVSLLLVSVIIFATVTFITGAFRSTAHNQEKEFATQKAISILDELKSFVEDKQGVGSLLDDFNELSDSPVLTIQNGAVPDDPVSSNLAYVSSPSGWLYTKQITVTPIGDADNRLVNVKVFTYKYGTKTLISEVAGVLRTIAPSFAPTQVYDVYLIAIDNIPGWWVYMQNIVPFVQATLQDIQSRNPGLEFRTHWIRKLSYGRDWQYAPYFNDTAASTANINRVYFYPGQLPVNDATYDTPGNVRPVSYYYLPSLVQARISIDGVIKNGFDNNPSNSTYNPWPYALADTYNNAMRWPDERDWFDKRVSVGKEFADAPTFRLLMEDMYQNPSNYRNSIVINLHGELFPFPPIRNYSDAARDPITFSDPTTGFPRVVTHPTQLRYTNNDNLVLRVYSYLNRVNTTIATNRQFLPTANPITVRLKNINWTPNAGDIRTIVGGADLNGDNIADAWGGTPINAPLCPMGGNNACYTPSIDGADTVLTLVRSPLVATQAAAGTGGLPSNWRLYGMEYIPAPMEIPPFTNGGANDAFSIDLTRTTNTPKNTARWIITVPDGVLPDDSMVTIETRIGTDKTLGDMYPVKNNPQDLSRTYTWRGTDQWIFGDGTFANPGNLPITERWQIIGDPRHLPYADQKSLQQFTASPITTHALGTGFNRYFDDFQNASADANDGGEWQGWWIPAAKIGIKNDTAQPWTTAANDDGWDVTEDADISAGFGQQGYLEVDVNRIMQVFRTVLLRTNSVFTTLSGFSFSYLGMGDEIDYDQSNGFISGVPVSSMPYTGSGGARYERSITSWPTDLSSTYHLKYIKRNNNQWFAKYWLGELFPDDVYAAQWDTNGNLTAGTGATDFLRVIRSSIPDTTAATPLTDLLPTGTAFVPAGRTTDEEGCTAFMNIGTTPITFHHQWSYDNINALVDETGDLQTPEGVEIANKFYMPFPTTAPIGRPFYMNSAGEGRAPDGFVGSPNPSFYDTGYTIAGNAAIGQRPAGALATTYYDSTEDRFGTGTGSGLVTLRETYNGAERGAIYNVVNGLDKTGESGTTLIGKWSVLSLTDAFLRSGQGNSPTRIRELPRILILPFTAAELNNQPTLNIQWSMNWLRWDGQEYVDAYPAGFTEDTQTGHVILYSTDNGVTWKNIKTDAVASPGVRPTNAGDFVIPNNADPATTPLSYNWPNFGDRCEGTILLRVEVYRDIDDVNTAYNLHYSYHQMRIFRRDPDNTGCS